MIAAGSGAAAKPEKKAAEPEKVMQPLPLPDLRHRRHRG